MSNRKVKSKEKLIRLMKFEEIIAQTPKLTKYFPFRKNSDVYSSLCVTNIFIKNIGNRNRKAKHEKIIAQTPKLTKFFSVKKNSDGITSTSNTTVNKKCIINIKLSKEKNHLENKATIEKTKGPDKLNEEKVGKTKDLGNRNYIRNFQNDLPKKNFDYEQTKECPYALYPPKEQEMLETNNLQNNKSYPNVVKSTLFEYDISQWPERMDNLMDFWIREGSAKIQNSDAKLLESKSYIQRDGNILRKCEPSMFERTLKNGSLVKRSWLCFSPTTGKVYCFHCKLFSSARIQLTCNGYCDWKNACSYLQNHEMSTIHTKSVHDFTAQTSNSNFANNRLNTNVEDEKSYWKKVVERIINIIICLTELNLPLEAEKLELSNNCNFVNLITLYDDFLKTHLHKFGQDHVNHLFSMIWVELIEAINFQLLKKIIENIKKSKYYSISIDSTIYVGHINQLHLVMRYIENNEPVDRFLTFMLSEDQVQDAFNALATFLENHNIDIKDCRGQFYNNSWIMSDQNDGLQALVKRKNKLALWIPCFDDTLNLIGTTVMSCCSEAKNFFDFLDNVYNYFTVSSECYDYLSDRFKESAVNNEDYTLFLPKKSSTIKWESRTELIRSIYNGFSVYKAALSQLSCYSSEVKGLYEIFTKFETNVYIVFWYDILERVNKTSLQLQSSDVDLNTSIELLKSLRSDIERFKDYENFGIPNAECEDYEPPIKRVRKQILPINSFDFSQTEATQLTHDENFRAKFYIPVINQINLSLDQRISSYEKIDNYFGFLKRLTSMSFVDIEDHASSLVNFYEDDLEDSLANELDQFKKFVQKFIIDRNDADQKEHICLELKMYKLINEKGLQEIFPNVCILLKIYLVLMTTNYTSEKSFSKLKTIKNKLGTFASQDCLNKLSLMSFDSDLLRKISYDEIINDFAKKIMEDIITN